MKWPATFFSVLGPQSTTQLCSNSSRKTLTGIRLRWACVPIRCLVCLVSPGSGGHKIDHRARQGGNRRFRGGYQAESAGQTKVCIVELSIYGYEQMVHGNWLRMIAP